MQNLLSFVDEHENQLSVAFSFCALLVSILALVGPSIKEWQDRRQAIFQALQEDRKAIAIVTLHVLRGDWDSRLKARKNFREQLLRSLTIAIGLESSDRGKAYVLAALTHIAEMRDDYREEVVKNLRNVREVFDAYVRTGADPKFNKERIPPLDAILKSLAGSKGTTVGGHPGL